MLKMFPILSPGWQRAAQALELFTRIKDRVILGLILILLGLATIPMANCPVCVDQVGIVEDDGKEVIYPCHVCGSYRKKVSVLTRWRFLYEPNR